MSSARFRVDPRLATLLGESYRSTERALKELVDNAWDADAQNVWIELPDIVSDQPIVIRDDGSGMTEQEIHQEYLAVASDRRTRKGTTTVIKKRTVKGRRGIGKFAGLVAASTMTVETKVKGVITSLTMAKSAILEVAKDLEEVDLPVQISACGSDEHGTTITLSDLNQNLEAPKPDVLKELLALEYGRDRDFTIFVNGEQLGFQDIPGEAFSYNDELPGVGKVNLQFKVMESGRPLAKAGIVTRVDGKIVGKPSFFGLDERDDFPKKLLHRISGEIAADGLEGDVTADWGAIIENSKARQAVQEWAQEHLNRDVEVVFEREIKTAQAQLNRQIRERLRQLPEYRRQFAQEALDRVMRKFSDLPIEKRNILASLVLDAMEKDEYFQVCQRIYAARDGDISNLADALNSFGLVAMTTMAYSAHSRIVLLNGLDNLALNPATLEMEMHKALESNLWVLGPEYSLMASNQTLKKTIEQFSDKKFSGARANKRPDLLLAQDMPDRMLLVEFKKPSDSLTRDHESQAKKYRDDLQTKFPGKKIDIVLIGGQKSAGITHVDGDTRFSSYKEVISNARNQMEWLLRELLSVNQND